MLRVLQPTKQTCLTKNQLIAGCEKLLQKVESTCSSTFCGKSCTSCTFYQPKANLTYGNKTVNKKCATCFATLLQNELNSDVACFTLLQDRLKREWQNAQHCHSTYFAAMAVFIPETS